MLHLLDRASAGIRGTRYGHFRSVLACQVCMQSNQRVEGLEKVPQNAGVAYALQLHASYVYLQARVHPPDAPTSYESDHSTLSSRLMHVPTVLWHPTSNSAHVRQSPKHSNFPQKPPRLHPRAS